MAMETRLIRPWRGTKTRLRDGLYGIADRTYFGGHICKIWYAVSSKMSVKEWNNMGGRIAVGRVFTCRSKVDKRSSTGDVTIEGSPGSSSGDKVEFAYGGCGT